MIKTIRRKLGDPLSAESLAQLKRVAEMPDSEIRTDLIPERRFDLALAAERRKSGWTPDKASAAFKASLKKARWSSPQRKVGVEITRKRA